MKITILSVALVGATAAAMAQTGTAAKDADLTGLTTPVLVSKGHFDGGLQFNSFGSMKNLVASSKLIACRTPMRSAFYLV